MGAADPGAHPRRDRAARGVLRVIEVRVPDEQEGTKAVVRAWLKQIGDTVALNDPLVELETDKVAVEVPAPAAGVLREILLDTDSEALPGAVLGRIAPVAEVAGHEPDAPPLAAPPQAGRQQLDPELRLSPAVKRALLQHDIDPVSAYTRLKASARRS